MSVYMKLDKKINLWSLKNDTAEIEHKGENVEVQKGCH